MFYYINLVHSVESSTAAHSWWLESTLWQLAGIFLVFTIFNWMAFRYDTTFVKYLPTTVTGGGNWYPCPSATNKFNQTINNNPSRKYKKEGRQAGRHSPFQVAADNK